MRQTLIAGLAAAAALVTVSAAPAMACGGYYASGCSPCGQAYVAPSPCGGRGLGGGITATALPTTSGCRTRRRNISTSIRGRPIPAPACSRRAPYYREATASRWNGYGHGYRHAYRSPASPWLERPSPLLRRACARISATAMRRGIPSVRVTGRIAWRRAAMARHEDHHPLLIASPLPILQRPSAPWCGRALSFPRPGMGQKILRQTCGWFESRQKPR